MADIQIVADGAPGVNAQISLRGGMTWINLTLGYFFYVDNDNPDDLNYVKTTDSGQTWGTPVVIASALATGFILSYDTWYERWTPGDTGNLIHILYAVNNADGIFHRALNVANDVLSAIVPIDSPVISAGSSSFSVSVTKSRGGNVYASWDILPAATGPSGFARSVDSGSTWVSRANLFAGEFNDDQVLLFPGNEADNQDIWAAYWDASTNELSLKTYDDSGDSWSEATVPSMAAMIDSQSAPQMAGAIRHSDNHLILVAHEDLTVAHDLKAWDINGAASITALTNVFSATADQFSVCLTLDQNSDDIYVAYYQGATPFLIMQCQYRISTDGGTTWGAEVQYSTTGRAYRALWATVSIENNGDGRWQPAIFAAPGPDVAYTNFDNSIAISGGIPPSPNPPTAVVSVGVGGLAGTILYITPDGQEYQLITPHDPGRHVLNFQGFGTPPPEYVTQRGPFQDGVTVKDFFIGPRTVQLLIRQNFCDRQAWWDGRSRLLDEIRPNRQTTPDGTTPGRLRIFMTDGTSRDLRVFISTGPIFEPTVADQWDEWSFQELLRFIAHDPILFSSTQTTSTFVITLDANLVFPITFPITFGSGEVDTTLNIAYDGTWKTFPIITIVGPIELPIINNNTTGEKLEFTRDIDPGQTVTIDLTEGVKTVVDQTGANLIGSLTTDSDIGSFHIAPDPEATGGLNVLRLRGQHPSGATSISLAFFVRYFGM